MNQQDNQQSSVEDLTVTQDQAADVKGGTEVPLYLQPQTRNEDSSPGKMGYDVKTNVKI